MCAGGNDNAHAHPSRTQCSRGPPQPPEWKPVAPKACRAGVWPGGGRRHPWTAHFQNQSGDCHHPTWKEPKKNKINKKGCSRFISESSIRWERRGRVGDVATASHRQTCLSPMSPATLTDEGVTKNKRAHPASTVGVRTSTPGGTCLENALARATFHKSRVDATRLCLGHRVPDVSTRI